MDYEGIGLRCGLEIHQQLNTKEKLFCRCPTILRNLEDSTYEIRRFLRPSQSELGEIDVAALEEFKHGKLFVYKGYDTTCLVECDEEPPREMNEEALDAAIEIALLLNMRIVDEVHTMRKIVIDGSNTCGFQRTALVAFDGYVDVGERIGIRSLCLEEDAAQKVDENENAVIYSLDRLGIPLVEIATEAAMGDPSDVRRVAEHIGMVMRSTGKIKRGLGTIRQDLNISISRGARTEIKGVQELGLLEEVVKREAERQLELLEVRDELMMSNASFDLNVDGSTAKITLKGYDAFVKFFPTEIFPRARKYGCEISYEDGVLMICGINAGKAADSIAERLRKALDENPVPEETRRALPDGSTEYMRPLPGPARMYPETDIPPIRIAAERIERIRMRLPELILHRKARYMREYGLSDDLASNLLSADYELFEEIVASTSIPPKVVARTLTSTLSELRRDGCNIDALDRMTLKEVFKLVSQGKASKEAIPEILREICGGKKLEEIVQGLREAGEEEVKRVVERVVSSSKRLISQRGMEAFKPLMGVVMKELRGRADGALIAKILKERMEKELE